MNTICGIDCSGCGFKGSCKGCTETNGHPFGGDCIAAECYRSGGENCFTAYKKRLIEEFNALGISDMPTITTLSQLSGAYINLEYTLPNGEKVKLLDDTKIYLGYQVEKANSNDGRLLFTPGPCTTLHGHRQYIIGAGIRPLAVRQLSIGRIRYCERPVRG